MNRRKRRAAKAEKHNGKSRIVSALAFWRNDTPEGLGVQIGFEDSDGNVFAAAVERALGFFDMKATPDQCLLDLARLAERKASLSIEETELAIVTIHWLERRGHLRSDEYNGVVWNSLQDRDLVVLSNTPSDPDILQESGLAAKVAVKELDTPDFERAVRALLHTDPSN